MANLPTVSEVNKAKGADLHAMYKLVIGESTTSKDLPALRSKIIAKLKEASKNGSNGHKSTDANAQYSATEKAAFDAEKKGEWLTAALAWESASKMLAPGKGRDICLERAAKARVNARVPAKAAKSSAAIDSAEVKAAKAAKEAERAAKEAAEKAVKEAAKAAKAAEKAAKDAKDEADALAKKATRDAEALAKKVEKEAAAATAKAAAAAKKAEKDKAALDAANTKEAEKAKKAAEREAKKTEKAMAKIKPFEHDPRIAHMVGQTIVHDTKSGAHYEIKVLADGLEYKGEKYKSLSAIGKMINAGKSTNGFVFFGLASTPRPELKDVSGIVGAYATAREGLGVLPKDLEKVLDDKTTVPEAHAAHAAITAVYENFEARAKALRLAARLIEQRKGRPGAAQ